MSVCVKPGQVEWSKHSMKMNCVALLNKTTLNVYVFGVLTYFMCGHICIADFLQKDEKLDGTLYYFSVCQCLASFFFLIKLHCKVYEEYA